MERKGADRDRIKAKLIREAKSVSEAIIKEATDGDYGTIVLGMRGLSKIDGMIRARMGNKILQLAEKKAVWVVH
jgi:hypothetical protein